MDVSLIKNTLYESKVQLILLNSSGLVLESDQSLFKVKKDVSIGTIHPFFEGVTHLLNDITEPIRYPCVNLFIDSKDFIVDIEFSPHNENLLLSIFDFTDHYQQSQPIIQEKNEASIIKNRLTFERDLLVAKEEFKNSFLAHLNHEIRNPLNSLLGFVEVLSETKLSYEQKETLSVIQKTGVHLKVLMDDMLDISKIERGQSELKHVPFNLGQILHNLTKHFQIKYEKSGVDFLVNVNKDVPLKLIGDPTRLNQIAFNLLENAFRNTKKGEEIVIDIKVNQRDKASKKVRMDFVFSDSGRGMPKEELENIFESYYQLKLDTFKPIGEGLGLKIVKELTNLLKGTIEVESVLNKGTTYTVTLPFEERLERSKKKRSVPKGSGIVLSKRILIVEDEEISQMLIMKTFLDNNRGFYIEIARTGKDALEFIEKRKYDLILLKMKLPDIDGFAILDFIRSHASAKIKALPILVTSGSTMKNEQLQFLEAGASAFLPKPYSKKELFKKIDELV